MKRFTPLIYILFAFAALTCLLSRCNSPKTEKSKIAFEFTHFIDGKPLQPHQMIYTNAAGNKYQVDEIQYFISDITLTDAQGKKVAIEADSGIHYVDTNIPKTLHWEPATQLPAGKYNTISFIFGISEAKNKSGLFVNPPERDMFWPRLLGGGYHYMKLNGKWQNGDTVNNFNFHLGIGNVKNGEKTEFIQNYFTVNLPLYFQHTKNRQVINLKMNIENWFKSPHMWDWNAIGPAIMQNQPAMRMGCENGAHVFSVEAIQVKK